MPDSLVDVLRRAVFSLNARAKSGVFSIMAPDGKFQIQLAIAEQNIVVWTEQDSWISVEAVCEQRIKALAIF